MGSSGASQAGNAAVASPLYNIKSTGAVKGNGIADDTVALIASINASPAGSTIVFPPGAYLVSQPIPYLAGGRRYLGLGHAKGYGARIVQKAGTNMVGPGGGPTALFVPPAWLNNATTCDGQVVVENLYFSPNRSANPSSTASGIILCNFWSQVCGCMIDGAAGPGILLTDVTADGVNVIVNSASECDLIDNKINDCVGAGIRQVSANHNSNQDGYCLDNRISGVAGHGIEFQRAAGWTFDNNHFYGVTGDGINADSCYATRITENYIENYGEAATPGTYYAGIAINQLNGRGTVITGNMVGCSEAGGSSFYQYIRAKAGSGQTNAHAVVADNTLEGPGTGTGYGIVVESASGGVMHTAVGDNDVAGINTPYDVADGNIVTSRIPGDLYVDGTLHLGGSTAATAAQLAGKVTKGELVINVADSTYGSDPFGTNPRAALAAAPAGSTVYFPPGTYTAPSGVGTGYTVAADNLRIIANGVTINVTTWGQPGIDAFNRSGIFVEGKLTVAYTGTRGSALGASYRGSAPYVNTCGFYTNRDRCHVEHLRTVGMPVGIFLSSYNGTGASDRMGVGNTIGHLECESANFGLLWVGQDGLRIDNIYVHDDLDDSSGGNPTHVYYCSGSAALGTTNLIIGNAVGKNILSGQAFQLKYVTGATLGPHVASNCKGLFNGIDLVDVTVSAMVGTGMLANAGQGSLTLQTTTNVCRRVQLDNVTVMAATGVDERLVRLAVADSEIGRMLVVSSRPASPANASDYDVIITGVDTRVRDLSIRSRGVGHVRPLLVATGSSNMTVEDFLYEATVGLGDVAAGCTGIKFRYAPGLQQGILSGSLYIGTLGGAADYSVSRSEHERAVTLASGSTTATPNPYLETRTYITVTDSSNITIAAPAGGTPNVGTTLDVVVANNSGGTMGTVTWNAAYTLLATYMKPAAGAATHHRFRHNGTGWIEIAATLPAQSFVSVTGLTGAVTPARFVGGTASGPPVSGTFAANDYVISTDGNMHICTVAGSPGTWVTVGTPASLTALAADALTTGELVPRRERITSNAVSAVSGTLWLAYFTADKSEAITTLTAFTGATAAAATPTLCRMGAYSVAGNGDLTLVASTPNDTALFAVTNTAAPKALSATWNKVVGQRYAVGILVVSGATMPSFHGLQLSGTGILNTLVRTAPAIAGRVASQTDLPSSVAVGSLVGFQAIPAIQMS